MAQLIEDLLDDIRAAVASGDYARLAALTPALETACDGLPSSAVEAEFLRHSASRVAASLTAAMAGIKAARRRIDEIAAAERGLTTYGRDGNRATLPASPPKSRRV